MLLMTAESFTNNGEMFSGIFKIALLRINPATSGWRVMTKLATTHPPML